MSGFNPLEAREDGYLFSMAIAVIVGAMALYAAGVSGHSGAKHWQLTLSGVNTAATIVSETVQPSCSRHDRRFMKLKNSLVCVDLTSVEVSYTSHDGKPYSSGFLLYPEDTLGNVGGTFDLRYFSRNPAISVPVDFQHVIACDGKMLAGAILVIAICGAWFVIMVRRYKRFRAMKRYY